MIDSAVVIPLMQALYSLVVSIAGFMWLIDNVILLAAYFIAGVREAAVNSIFVPVLGNLSDISSSIVGGVFMAALLVLALTYLLSVFFRFDVVDFKSALAWWFVAGLLFSTGPALYTGFEDFRVQVGGFFYQASAEAAASELAGAIPGIENVSTSSTDASVQMNEVTDIVGGSEITSLAGIDGIDMTLAYLLATECDLFRFGGGTGSCSAPAGVTQTVPYQMAEAGGGSFFDAETGQANFGSMDQDARLASLQFGAQGIFRLFSGILMAILALIEQVVQLVLAVAFMLGFAAMYIAILFAFFKKTGSIAWSAFEVILQLFIQSIITSLTLAVLMGMIQIGAGTGNALMLLGVTVVGLIMIFSLLSSALNAVQVAFTGLFNSFNSVTGGISVSGNTVAEGTENAATGAASAAAIKAQGGSSAMALGAMFDGQQLGQQAFYASRMLGGDETTAGQMLSEFGAGVYARNVGDEVGGPAGAAISGGLMASQMSNAREEQAEQQERNRLRTAAMLRSRGAVSAVRQPLNQPDRLDAATLDAGRARPVTGTRPLPRKRSLQDLPEDFERYRNTGQVPGVARIRRNVNTDQLTDTFASMNDENVDDLMGAIARSRQRRPGQPIDSGAFRQDVGNRLDTSNPLAYQPEALGNVLEVAAAYENSGTVPGVPAAPSSLQRPNQALYERFRQTPANQRDAFLAADFPDRTPFQRTAIGRGLATMGQGDVNSLIQGIQAADAEGVDPTSRRGQALIQRQFAPRSPVRQDQEALQAVTGAFTRNAARAETADQLASGLNRAAIQPTNTATSAVIGYPAPGIQPFPADTTGTRPESGTNNRSRPADETGSTIRRSDIRPDSHAGPDRTKNERRRPQALSGNRTPPQDPSQPSNTSRRPPAGSSDSSAARPAEPPQNTVAASSRQGTSGTDSVPAQQFRRDRTRYLNAGQAVGAKPAQLKAMVRSAQQSETGRPTRQTVQAVRAQVVRQVGSEGAIAAMNPLTGAASKLARAARQIDTGSTDTTGNTGTMSGASGTKPSGASPAVTRPNPVTDQ